jgi:hypothetical protein
MWLANLLPEEGNLLAIGRNLGVSPQKTAKVATGKAGERSYTRAGKFRPLERNWIPVKMSGLRGPTYG